MFGHYAKTMTESSGHYLDWSRTGELLLSAAHRYSCDELLVRGFIVASIAISAYLGAAQNNEEKTHCSSLTMSFAAGLTGFVVSHAIVLIPLVKKRYEMSMECQRIADEIKKTTSQLLYAKEVAALVDHISRLSLSDEQHGNASMTWGTRRRCLLQLVVTITEKCADNDFWRGTPEQLMAKLEGNTANTAPRLR